MDFPGGISMRKTSKNSVLKHLPLAIEKKVEIKKARFFLNRLSITS
jgi:hypothetical protein